VKKRRLLVTRTRDDLANEYCYVYAEEVLALATDLGWDSNKAEDEHNTKKEVQNRLRKTNPDFVFFNGHGDPSCITGYKKEKLVTDKSASLLSEKIVYARSCDALGRLGKAAVSKGCKAFIGYAGKFMIPRTAKYESTPLKDETAKPVMEVSNIIPKKVLDGSSVYKAVDASQSRAREFMLKMLSSEKPYDSATFRALWNNYNFLSFEGNPKSKV
jgi:hypothetical protein